VAICSGADNVQRETVTVWSNWRPFQRSHKYQSVSVYTGKRYFWYVYILNVRLFFDNHFWWQV